MASPKAQSRYAAALRDPQSPVERGRQKVLMVKTGNTEQPPSPDAPLGKGQVASRWQVAAQRNFSNSIASQSSSASPSPFTTKSPPPPPAGQPPSRTRVKMGWDAEKEIPKGTVSSSPFKPITAPPPPPPPPPPQLRQQKNQWDAKRDIPKGTVQQARQLRVTVDQRPASNEAIPNVKFDGPLSPRAFNFPPSPDNASSKRYVNSSPRVWESGGAEPDVRAIDSPKRLWDAESEIPKGVVNKMKSNRTFFAEGPDPETTSQTSRNKTERESSRDIPRGKVKGISNMFASGNAKPDPPINQMEPLDPPGPSPVNSYPSNVANPAPILSSQSKHEEIKPPEQHQPTVQQGLWSSSPAPPSSNDANDTNDNDVWSIPASSSGALFGKGTWGEEPTLSHSNDEYEDQDWFQAGSFTDAEEKKECIEQELKAFKKPLIDARSAFPSPPTIPKPVDDDDEDDDDEEYTDSDSNIGSFAAAIQPVTSRLWNAKPETVAEEPDEDAVSVLEPLRSNEVKALSHTNAASPNLVKRKTFFAADTTPSKSLQMLSEANEEDNDQIKSDVRSVASKGSKSSKSSLLGFRKKVDAPSSDLGSEKKRRGIFNIFSRRDSSKNTESLLLKPGSSSSDMPLLGNSQLPLPPLQDFAVSRTVAPTKNDQPKIDIQGSLQRLSDEMDRERAKGVISTRDDMTAVSEMTNPTVFLKQVPTDSIDEKVVTVYQRATEERVSETTTTMNTDQGEDKKIPLDGECSSIEAKTLTSLEVVSDQNLSLIPEADPFDIHSPIFLNRDPFASKGHFGVEAINNLDPFSDPFFDTLEHGNMYSGTFSVDNPVSDDIDPTPSFDVEITDHVVDSTEKPILQEGKPLPLTATWDSSKTSIDVPDPEIEFFSSDDESEADETPLDHYNTANIIPITKNVASLDDGRNQVHATVGEVPLKELIETASGTASTIAEAGRRVDRFKPYRMANRGTLSSTKKVGVDEVKELVVQSAAPVKADRNQRSGLQMSPAHSSSRAKSFNTPLKPIQSTIGRAPTIKAVVPSGVSPSRHSGLQTSPALSSGRADSRDDMVKPTQSTTSKDLILVGAVPSSRSPSRRSGLKLSSGHVDSRNAAVKAMNASPITDVALPSGESPSSGSAHQTFRGRSLRSVDYRGSPVPVVKPADSADSETSKSSGGVGRSQLASKMRAKQLEKNMRRSKQHEEEIIPLPIPKAQDHVSTSAYLNRFKAKVQGKTGMGSPVEKERYFRPPAVALNSPLKQNISDAHMSASKSSDAESDPINAIESVDSHFSLGSRSYRRTFRSKFNAAQSAFEGDPKPDVAATHGPPDPQSVVVPKKNIKDSKPSLYDKMPSSNRCKSSASILPEAAGVGADKRGAKDAIGVKTLVYQKTATSNLDAGRGSIVPSTGRLDTNENATKPQGKPQSILRKPKLGIPVHTRPLPKPADKLSQFEVANSNDPLHRAGLRLLGAAVIPIQSEMRRFLAKREALNRMWGIIVIQSFVRRWLVLRQIDCEEEAALIIQAAFADYLTREYARVLIQAHVRRWLVQKRLREKYAATLIQTQFRRWVHEQAYLEYKAVLCLQKFVRMWTQRQQFVSYISARRIQTNFRRWVLERAYQEHKAIVCIQKNIRRYSIRKEFVRLVSSIRIQKHVRGMIVYKEYVRTVAAIQIQRCARGMAAYKTYWFKLLAAIQIQAIFRGWLARDLLEDRHYCATQIQRIYRGYRATMSVYDDIYRVTMVQSFVRMKIAIEKAANKLAVIIQVQSIIRGCLVRTRLQLMNSSAIVIQCHWRGLLMRLNHASDLIDIILVQSLFRQWKGKLEVEKLRHERRVRCATVIQAQWRCYDCMMNYLHDLADVIMLQSAVRRWSACRKTLDLRNVRDFESARLIQSHSRGFMVRNQVLKDKAAQIIQKVWRGFVSYAEYMFTIADIVVAQGQARCWLARRKRMDLIIERDNNAATTIQTQWRGFVARTVLLGTIVSVVICQSAIRGYIHQKRFQRALVEKYSAETIQHAWFSYIVRRDEKAAATSIQRRARGLLQRKKYAVALEEHYASIKIQSAWRRFWLFSNFVITLDSLIVAQSVVRCYLTRLDLRNKAAKATIIQAKQRSVNARIVASAKSMVRALFSASTGIADKENDAAVVIQSNVRGSIARSVVLMHRKALMIQTNWRGVIPRRDLKHFRAAVRLQSCWRRHTLVTNYTRYISASRVQKAWRGCVARSWYLHYMGVRKIQTAWRAHRDQTAYTNYKAASKIQTSWRFHSVRSAYMRYQAAKRIQASWRCYRDQSAYKNFRGARKIQASWRGHRDRTAYTNSQASKRIQTVWRLHCALSVYRSYQGAKKIQAVWRCHSAVSAYNRFKGARKIQAAWRCYIARETFVQWLVTIEAATMIQSAWRSFVCYTDYIFTLADIVTVQRRVRGYIHRKVYATKYEENQQRLAREREQEFRRQSGATNIQRIFRGYVKRMQYILTISAINIQRIVRGHVKRTQYIRTISAINIQRIFRGHVELVKYNRMIGAIEIQRTFRGHIKRVQYIRTVSAVKIQKVFRGYVNRVQYSLLLCAIDIQRVFRGSQTRAEVNLMKRQLMEERTQENAVITIQKNWRAFDYQHKFWYLLGCTVVIQTIVRGHLGRRHFAEAYANILIVQSIARRWFACRDFRQMRLIRFLLSAAKLEETEKDNAAKTIQHWYKVWKISRKKVVAAIKIQSFFRMVEAFVDKEVKAEKRRRKLRKEQKKSRTIVSNPVEEELLDAAWEVISISRDSRKCGSKSKDIVAELLGRSMTAPRQKRQDDSSGRPLRSTGRPRDSIKSRLPNIADVDDDDSGILGERPTSMVRLGEVDDSDAMSEMSGLTAPTVFRVAPSRLEMMGDKEMAADLSLEEAWVDMEIHNVKEKKKLMVRSRKSRWSSTQGNTKV